MSVERGQIRGDQGFTMMEVIVALCLFGIFTGAMIPTFQGFMQHVTQSAVKTEAIAVASMKFDQLREEAPDSMPSSGTVGPETVSGGRRSYQVYTTYCSNAGFCPGTRTRHIEVDVRYRGVSVYNAESVYTRLR